MKIDFYISSLSGGGAENVLTTLAKEFKNDNHSVSITSLEKRPQFYKVDDGIELIKYDNKNKGRLKEIITDFKAIRKQMKKRKDTDVCVSFLSRCNLQVLLCSLFLNKKVIVCDRNNPLMEHSKPVFYLSCQIYRLATAVFVQTEKIKSFYPKYLQKKIYVLENPVDTEKLDAQAPADIEKENTIISIGRLEPQKDFKTLISAFAKVAVKYPHWKVKIFGKGDMREELQAFIDEKGLTERVLLCGRTETPFKELKKSKIFVLSSHYEGFPNVLCEGMYAGLGCISSDCVSGPSELINEGVNGYLFDVGDVDMLTNKLDKLMNDEKLRAQVGNAANETVKERLLVSSIYKKWEKLIKDLI